VRNFDARRGENEIGRAEWGARDVGRREEAQELFGNRADATGRNDVAGKLRAPGTVSIARRRVVDRNEVALAVFEIAEVAPKPFGVRNCVAIDEALLIGRVLIIAEIEKLVLPDWSADGGSSLPVKCRGSGVREVFSRL